MNISQLIERLKTELATHGDLDVVTDDYNGGDYELRDADPVVSKVQNSETLVVVMRGRGIY